MEQSIKRIKDTVCKYGGDNAVLIVAATKTVDAERINRLKDYGIFDAGENRVQELLQKYDEVVDTRWHFIGVLQKNKVKYIVDKVCLIHSVDSLSLAEEIDKRAAKIAKIMDILVEVNIGGEPTKSGISKEELFSFCDNIIKLSNVRLRGLMTVMPPNADEGLYGEMKNIFVQVRQRYGGKPCTVTNNWLDKLLEKAESNKPSVDFLSMGMSGDFETALKYGANIIRPGSAIFGKRSYQV